MEDESSSNRTMCYISPSTGDQIMERITTKPGYKGSVVERTNFTEGTVEVVKKF